MADEFRKIMGESSRTGKIITSPTSKAYRDGWDTIFGTKTNHQRKPAKVSTKTLLTRTTRPKKD